MNVNEAAEAVAMAFLAVKRQVEEEISLKAGLYEAAKIHKPSTNALRLARKILHIYALNKFRVSSALKELLGEAEVSDESRILLSLLISALLSDLSLGEPEKLAIALRKAIGKLWPRDVEPWLGVIRAIEGKVIDVPKLENYANWFVKVLYRVLGRSEAKELMKFQDEEKPRTYIVFNTLLASRGKIFEELEKAGIKLSEDKRLPGIYLLEKAEDTRKLVKFSKKSVILIQDFSSYYAVHAADPKPEMKILDVCAAPGAKTSLMGIRMKNKGLVISVDSSIERLRTHLHRIRRAGIEIVEDVLADATNPLPFNFKADIVLIDPPCSSTGLFWREPAYRWMIKPRHVKMFARLQAKMLENSAKHVKENGYLVYSTCSVSLEENEILLEDFLKRHPEFELSEIDPALGSNGLREMKEARRLYPHKDLCNGFFVAKIRRKW